MESPVIDATATPITPTIDKSARQWAMLSHISGLVIFVGIPFGNIIAPLAIWLMKRETHPYIDQQGKEALNFQISATIYGLIAGLLCFILIGFVALPILLVADIILTIQATLRADKGEAYQYPFTIRFIK